MLWYEQYNTIQFKVKTPYQSNQRNETKLNDEKRQEKKKTNICVLSWKILQPNANAKLWQTIQNKLKPNLTSDLLFVVSQRSCLFVRFGSENRPNSMDTILCKQWFASIWWSIVKFWYQYINKQRTISKRNETKRYDTSNDWRIMIR